MKFIFLENQEGRCYIDDFLSRLDDDTHLKITNKLEDFEGFDLFHLFKARHLKKVEEGVHEVRVRIKSECYRFLGRIRDEEFEVVHVYHKKTDKLPPKEIQTTRNRLKNIKL